MGVKGLTTYVNQRADVYFKNYRLQNGVIIIDGFALASCLYSDSINLMHSSFGGDYDKYAKIVLNFFELLESCGVFPIVLCDGGCEKRKLKTIRKRTYNKIISLERATPLSHFTNCFPLMLRHVFRDVLLSRNVAVLQSDFEADSEIAALARKLNVPVLSNDSDFFIFDVQYIPLSSMNFSSFSRDERGQYYIPCQIYHVDNLLKGFGGLSKSMLPLLATLLGNDYSSSEMKKFCSRMKIKSKNCPPGERKVRAVLGWLKNKSFQTALDKILTSVAKPVRKSVMREIKMIMKGYTNLSTPLDSYLPKEIQSRFHINSEVNELAEEFNKFVFVEDNDECEDATGDEDNDDCEDASGDEDNDECEGGTGDEDDNDSEDSAVDEDSYDCEGCVSDDNSNGCDLCVGEELGDVISKNDFPRKETTRTVPAHFLHESRKVNLCSTIITLISLKLYLFDPQVEDYSLPHAGHLSLPILEKIICLLGIDSITYWSRLKRRYVGRYLNSPVIGLSSISSLNCLRDDEKKKIIFDSLKIENHDNIELFPCEWQLFILSILYWSGTENELSVKPCHFHALITSVITLSVINSKIGIFLKRKFFVKSYEGKLKALSTKPILRNELIECQSIREIIDAVSKDECILAMDILLKYFHVDDHLKRRPQNFSRSTIHLFNQLQYTFHLVTTLNSLLAMPFKRSNLSMFFNGTFLYNFSVNLKHRRNILSYIENLFIRVPVFKNLHIAIYHGICSLSSFVPEQNLKVRKQKPRKKTEKKEVFCSVESGGEGEDFYDINNKYSVLCKVNK